MSNLISTDNGSVYAPGLKERGHIQRQRTAVGIANGSLTSNEVDVLQDMGSAARGSLAEAKGNNGWVGPQERVALHKDLNNISDTIHTLKHN